MELYDRLLQFTLFQGMSHADLMEVAGHTKFGFHKLAAGKRIVNEGDDCLQLLFLTHGTVRCETRNDGNAYRVEETIKAPYTLQPERLFGLNQRYTTSFKTLT
ncbi:MAG: Crp/Fnr family transcriptional regulator, partial [Prevotella sp.]|nr:Crp/Fnr family transcriptional regulator [Prevotella sp.]